MVAVRRGFCFSRFLCDGFLLGNLPTMFRVNHRSAWTVFGLAFVAAFMWACFTGHVWEDYYITYRSSKNLATGHGLVFNHGERLHTFTSPLGVLLPAAASLLTGNSSDGGGRSGSSASGAQRRLPGPRCWCKP